MATTKGIYTIDGRKWKAEMAKLAASTSSPATVQGVFWCAVGQGDGTFPADGDETSDPPAPLDTQTGCKSEQIRKKTTDVKFVVPDAAGLISYNGVRYTDSGATATQYVLATWVFDFSEANFYWKEMSFHAGNVTYSVGGDVAVGGLSGEVTGNGRCLYVQNIPARKKDTSTQRTIRLLITF